MAEKRFHEAFGVTGFVPSELAERLEDGGDDVVEVRVASGRDDVVMRVKRADVAEVRLGATSDGETTVQLILDEGHEVETVLRHKATVEGVMRFHDPALSRLTARAVATVIMA